MSSNTKPLHLFGFMVFSPMSHTVGQWRHPRSFSGFSFAEPDVWQNIARTLERGRFDGVFFADQLAAATTYDDGSLAPSLEHALQFPVHDPMILLPMMAAVTEHLGLISTMSATYYQPYLAVRKMSTLDHLSRGRAGWNIVTSFHINEAQNCGLREPIPHDQRYARAEEYMEVCFKLWDSWEPGAVVEDRARGVFTDPSKVHRIEHDGPYFLCPGFSPVSPSPQHHPVLFQAGASGAGRDFCARWAEMALIIQHTTRAMRSYREDLDQRVKKYGRDPSEVKLINAVQLFVAETERAAVEKRDEINALTPYEGGLALLSGHTGVDFSKYDPDTELLELSGQLPGIRGVFEALTTMHHERLTLREAGLIHARGVSCPQIAGDPEQVADQMIAMAAEGGIDGYNITPTYSPGCYDEIVDLVVPVLQAKGAFRREYVGSTLREHIHQYSEADPVPPAMPPRSLERAT